MKYKFKRKPYRHQVDALKKLLDLKYGGALLMEPRTGKTQVCLDFTTIRHKQGAVNRVVIVCPVSVMSVWEDEIAAVVNAKYRILVWDKKTRRRKGLPAYGKDTLDFVIVNYDAFSTPGRMTRNRQGEAVRSRRGGRYEVIKQLRAWQPQLMILDESHRIKTSSAKKSSGVKMVAWKRSQAEGLLELVPFRIIATGTAVTKKKRVFDIYSQWRFLDPHGWISGYTMDSFKAEYGIWKPARLGNYETFVGNQNEDKLHLRIHRDGFAVARDECFDLPARRTQLHYVELEGETARIYDELATEMIAKLNEGEITEAQLRIVLDLRLSQLTSGVAFAQPTEAYPKGRLLRVGQEKLDLLEDRLLDLFEADEKVVIACQWRSDLAAVEAMVQRMRFDRKPVPCYSLHGGVKSRLVRDQNRRNFQARPGPSAFVMQPQAGSLGIDLSTSATMIWVSLTRSYVDWTQANDRTALSPRGTVMEVILARGTVDEIRYQALQEDGDVVKSVMRSPDVLNRNYRASE